MYVEERKSITNSVWSNANQFLTTGADIKKGSMPFLKEGGGGKSG